MTPTTLTRFFARLVARMRSPIIKSARSAAADHALVLVLALIYFQLLSRGAA